MKSITTWLIVGVTTALVFLPVIGNQMRAEIARWHLAAAANAVTLGSGDPEPYLSRAAAAVDDTSKLRDYWLFRVKQALFTAPETAPDVLRAAIAESASNRTLAGFAAGILDRQEDFAGEIEVLELLRRPDQPMSDVLLNQLAYLRSLVSKDLEQALADINQALERRPDEPAYRDTRAWVLFRLGKFEEALEDADFAVKQVEPEDWLTKLLDDAPNTAAKTEEKKTTQLLTRSQAGERLWAIGALRYHRARILESLGRADDAQADWDWLADHNLPQDDRIF